MNWITFLQPIATLALTTVLGIGGAIGSAYVYKKWGITIDKNLLNKAVNNTAVAEEDWASGKYSAKTGQTSGEAKNNYAVNLQVADTGQTQAAAQKDVSTAVAISPNIGATSICKISSEIPAIVTQAAG